MSAEMDYLRLVPPNLRHLEGNHLHVCGKRGNLRLVENEQERFMCDFGCLYIRSRADGSGPKRGSLLYGGDFGNRRHLTKIVDFRNERLYIPSGSDLHIDEVHPYQSYRVGNDEVEYFKPDNEYLKTIFSYPLSRVYNNSYRSIKNYLMDLKPCFLNKDELNKILEAVEKLPEL
jgi:hypothetical protein